MSRLETTLNRALESLEKLDRQCASSINDDSDKQAWYRNEYARVLETVRVLSEVVTSSCGCRCKSRG